MAFGKPHPSRFPDTRWSLVGRAADSDEGIRQQAMAELLSLYTPGFRAFLVQTRRIDSELADDLLQDFIADKLLASQLIRQADVRRGKFRSFVLKCLNNFVNSRLRSHLKPGTPGVAHSLPEEVTVERTELSDVFDRQWINQVVADALQMMEADCTHRGRADLWEVLRLRVVEPVFRGVEPVTYDQLVEMLAIGSPRQAMNLLANAKRCFFDHLRVAVGRYVDHDSVEEEIADLRAVLSR